MEGAPAQKGGSKRIGVYRAPHCKLLATESQVWVHNFNSVLSINAVYESSDIVQTKTIKIS